MALSYAPDAELSRLDVHPVAWPAAQSPSTSDCYQENSQLVGAARWHKRQRDKTSFAPRASVHRFL